MVRTPSTKQYLISDVPAVLILHLKRFQSHRMSFSKVMKHVKFPTVLNLAPICENHDEPKVYSLYGVVEHSGTLYGGHYVAYVKVCLLFFPYQRRTRKKNIIFTLKKLFFFLIFNYLFFENSFSFLKFEKFLFINTGKTAVESRRSIADFFLARIRSR